MNTPAFADASLGADIAACETAGAAATRPDVLFLLNNLGFGGSERKVVRLSNRLKEEGVHVRLACLNGPYDLESGVRRDLLVTKLERRGKFSLRTAWQLRGILALLLAVVAFLLRRASSRRQEPLRSRAASTVWKWTSRC